MEDKVQQTDGVDSLVGDSFDPWSTTVICEFGLLELSSCNLTVLSSFCSQIPRVLQK